MFCLHDNTFFQFYAAWIKYFQWSCSYDWRCTTYHLCLMGTTNVHSKAMIIKPIPPLLPKLVTTVSSVKHSTSISCLQSQLESVNIRIQWILFVCLGLTSLLYIWGRIAIVPACSSGILTNVMPHRNTMPQSQDMTPKPVTVYRHKANLSLCYS